MFRNTYAAVDLNNIWHNVKEIQSVLKSGTQIMAVVKADAYGHGILEVSRTALDAGATWLAVALPEEAAFLCENGVDCPILILGKSNTAQKRLAVSLGIHLCVCDADDVKEIAQIAGEEGKQAYAHVKVDSGMGRIGVRSLVDFERMIGQFITNANVSFSGIFTHFACSDEVDKTFTMRQAELFGGYVRAATEAGFKPFVHASNSAAAIELPELNFDAIRLGISLYGYYPSKDVRHQLDLRPVLQVNTEIIYLKEIEPNETVGYGATFTAKRKTKVATLPIGYGDGYNRLLSNRGRVIVVSGGKSYYANVIGRVCMDQTMLDVTDIPGVQCGDRVIVMGSMEDKRVDADELADLCGTISYEILLSYSKRVPRIFIECRDKDE